MDALPFEGLVETEKTEPLVRPSASVALRVSVMVESSGPEPEVPEETTAGSSTAVMVRSMSCVVVPPASSVMVTVKASMPLKLAVGV